MKQLKVVLVALFAKLLLLQRHHRIANYHTVSGREGTLDWTIDWIKDFILKFSAFGSFFANPNSLTIDCWQTYTCKYT